MRLRGEPGGTWELSASHGSLLFALSALMAEEWAGEDASVFREGRTVRPPFPFLRNMSDFLVGSVRRSRGFSPGDYFRQIARSGFTHVTINGLGADRPFETGPPGDVYSWFYDYSPDIDQFVAGSLTRGLYPEEYLRANLEALKANAACAESYGLVPGLHINSPRSMPEAFWDRYPYLRGARIDHPRESFLPRYTLALTHPASQGHYRELVRAIFREVPALGFMHIWTNDSGAGFEFVSGLYAGRNGGPYLVREWKSDDAIARAAAGNVLAYYRLLYDESARCNPRFRLICDLGSFAAERKYIVTGMGGGIDAGDFGSFAGGPSPAEEAALEAAGALTHVKVDAGGTNVIGMPFPWLLLERLAEARDAGAQAILIAPAPASLAPYDVNGEVLRAFQCGGPSPTADVIARCARAWAGERDADTIIGIWRHADGAVRAFPAGVPLSTFAYPWFRLSVRPFVADIERIPENDRAYYERFLLATFNNPARVDLNNDMLWNFLTPAEAAEKRDAIDARVFPEADAAIAGAAAASGRGGGDVFDDMRDRLEAWRSWAETLRNMCAWTAGVHGYLRAATDEERRARRAECRATVARELANARALLSLWRRSRRTFMPVD
ncbi:MAG TPA: hypothetical protein VMM80_07610, partial [Bacteroidota bacterium]|nr:hypothetical protein [Bacteroidota bacterium]